MEATTPQPAPSVTVEQRADQTCPDLLKLVVDALQERKGTIRDIARAAGMSYDTVLRIKNGENDPSYGKVRRLAEVLGVHA